jgi:adenylate cyclase
MDLLNEYFGLMVEEVFNEHGVLDKFMGDALMAVYGIPYPQRDDAIRAVRTALSMMSALDGLNTRREAQGLSPIRIGIGINTDEVLSGNMGSSKRMDYTVIGDGVNVSARLESLNKHYGTSLLVSESTCAHLDNQFRVRLIDTVVTKGKSHPVDIYEALGPRDHRPSPAQLAYEQGLAAYRAGRFEDAAEIFSTGAGADRPSAVMLARCRAFLANPPPAPWDGVWRALEK